MDLNLIFIGGKWFFYTIHCELIMTDVDNLVRMATPIVMGYLF